MLKDKIAVITGSVKGIGKAIALALAKQGATVVIHYNTNEKLAKETLQQIKKFSKDSILVKADVTKENEVKRMFEIILNKFGRVDILVNNVGNFIFKNISQVSTKEWKDVIESNLYSVFYCTKQVLPRMRKNQYGRIINIGCASCDRLTIREKTTPYYIAKSGVLMLSKVLSAEEAKFDININVISPGVAENSVVKPKNMPKGRYASFDDIVNAVLFLLSEESDYITGANIEVSGGWIPGY